MLIIHFVLSEVYTRMVNVCQISIKKLIKIVRIEMVFSCSIDTKRPQKNRKFI